jgi:hypothetical protein
MSSGDPLAGPAPAAPVQPPTTPEDETVIMRANDQQPTKDETSRNGSDEGRAAKAPAARTPDESE